MQLEDGLLAAWGDKLVAGPPYLVCPYYASDSRVPRSDADLIVGDVTLDLLGCDVTQGYLFNAAVARTRR